MGSRFRQRLARRKAARAEAFDAAIEHGRVLFSGNPEEYRAYLMENGASWDEAKSIAENPYQGQRLQDWSPRKAGYRR